MFRLWLLHFANYFFLATIIVGCLPFFGGVCSKFFLSCRVPLIQIQASLFFFVNINLITSGYFSGGLIQQCLEESGSKKASGSFCD
jgi:hypothetical protein